MSAPESIDHRSHALDVVRGLAALSVFLYHVNVVPINVSGPAIDFWKAVWHWGVLGVPVFFALSGFCITQSWLRTRSAKSFVRRRFWRIFPAYWGSLALIVLLAVGFKLFNGVNDMTKLPASPGAIAATLLLATDPVTAVPTVNWVYWSLSFELAFYAVMALLFLVRPPFRCGALSAVHVFFCLTGSLFKLPLFFAELWPLFGMGAAVAMGFVRPRLSLCMLAASVVHLAVPYFHGQPLTWGIAAALSATACYLIATKKLECGSSLMSKIGECSYSLYLIHVPLGIYLFKKLLPSIGTGAAGEILRQFLVISAISCVAWGFYRLLERPFMAGTFQKHPKKIQTYA